MNSWSIAAIVMGIASLICYAMVIIDAFEDEFIRGILCIIFPPYAWWYGWTEYEHDKKWLIIGCMILGPFLMGGFLQVAINVEMDRIEKGKQVQSVHRSVIIFQPANFG